jgi:hypothetical protein
MVDIEKIKKEYERINAQGQIRLLPIEKIIALENFKLEITEKYLSKIIKIKGDFEIISEGNFTINDIIKFAKPKFGDLNFFDKNNEEEKLGIDMAFNFCIISLRYSKDKMKCKVTVFWDK